VSRLIRAAVEQVPAATAKEVARLLVTQPEAVRDLLEGFS
jgi:hypothetical protein